MNTTAIEVQPSRFIDDYLLYLMARASHLISSEFHEQLRRRGVAVPVWRVLASLAGGEGETVTSLADLCLLQQPTMTKLLDRMVRDGLVNRTPDGRDRRVVRITLTAQGAELVAGLLPLARRPGATGTAALGRTRAGQGPARCAGLTGGPREGRAALPRRPSGASAADAFRRRRAAAPRGASYRRAAMLTHERPRSPAARLR